MTFASNFKKFFVGTLLLAIAVGVYFYVTAPKVQALESLSSVAAGDLFRGESSSAVYYMGADGFRYVFPNQKTYDTWYDNFDNIKFIADNELATVQIGGNVTYRPGVKMIKINTDNATYAVTRGGVLRHVTSESVAIDLYGANWNQEIHDVADGFFTNYSIGDPIEVSSQYDVAAETAGVSTINFDKDLKAPVDISITDSGYSPLDATINAGESIRFTNTGVNKHTATGDDLSWGTGTIEPGGSYIQTFNEAGTFTFFDSYDSTNTGAIFVQ